MLPRRWVNAFIFSRMGYFADQGGIVRRARRERQGWEPHLERTRQEAIRAMAGKERRLAIVLGSGWLLDVPLDELSARFDRIVLADIRHPAAVRRRVRKMANVSLLACDISGFALPVYRYVQQYRNRKDRPPLETIEPEGIPDLNAYDFVFSCNILSQLDILLTDYLARYFRFSDDELKAFRSKVHNAHIASLPHGRSLVVTDVMEIVADRAGQELSRRRLTEHPLAESANRWLWSFDTGSYYHDRITTMEVTATDL